MKLLTILATILTIPLLTLSAPAFTESHLHHIEKRFYQTNDGRVAGNIKGDVTVVDFFDYRCRPCRMVSNELRGLILKDPELRVVYVDEPVLGDASVYAARAALAARYQHKYLALHHAMITAREPLAPDVILRMARGEGMSTKQLQADIGSTKVSRDLQDNQQLAQAFNIKSVPIAIVAYTNKPHKGQVYGGRNLLRIAYIVDTLRANRS